MTDNWWLGRKESNQTKLHRYSLILCLLAALHRGLHCLQRLKPPSCAEMHHTLEFYTIVSIYLLTVWENPSEYIRLQSQQQSQHTISVTIFFLKKFIFIRPSLIKAPSGHYNFLHQYFFLQDKYQYFIRKYLGPSRHLFITLFSGFIASSLWQN